MAGRLAGLEDPKSLLACVGALAGTAGGWDRAVLSPPVHRPLQRGGPGDVLRASCLTQGLCPRIAYLYPRDFNLWR